MGTVHPYTGDGMVVTELQGISPMALIDKLTFLHPRKSKRRMLIDEVKEVLMRSVGNRGSFPSTPKETDGDAVASEASSRVSEGEDDQEFELVTGTQGESSKAAVAPSKSLDVTPDRRGEEEEEGRGREGVEGEESSSGGDEGDSEYGGSDEEARGKGQKFATPAGAGRREGEGSKGPPPSPVDAGAAKKRKGMSGEAVVPPSPGQATPADVPPPMSKPPLVKPKQLAFSPARPPVRASPSRSPIVKTPAVGTPLPAAKPQGMGTPLAKPPLVPRRVPHPTVDSSEEEEGEAGGVEEDGVCEPTAVLGFTSTVGAKGLQLVCASPSTPLPHLPSEVPVPTGAASATALLPDHAAMPQLLLRVLQVQ